MMSRHQSDQRPGTLWILAMTLAGLASCDTGQTVTLTLQDNRFVPDLIHVRAGLPVTLTLFNAGREMHEFAGPLLEYATGPAGEARIDPGPTPQVVTLEPGRSATLIVTAPPGTYLYWCKRKGHPNMTGTLIIE